jgi:hypothetical protein
MLALGGVLAAIQFDNQLGVHACKIDNVMANWSLTAKPVPA